MGSRKLSEILKENLAADQLRDFRVQWDTISGKDVEALRNVIESAVGEREPQKFLRKHPLFLVQHLKGGAGRWCIPQKRLGAEHVPDFVIGERSSLGYEWYGVELKSPKAHIFTRNGDPAKELNHALRQIADWRIWLKKNIDYASRSRNQKGLGLMDIDSDLPCLILIGRRKDLDEGTQERRRQIGKQNKVQIHTYDWLLDTVEKRVEILTSGSSDIVSMNLHLQKFDFP
ncbi:hypothetical protein ES703_124910 [subsurface metagenome]